LHGHSQKLRKDIRRLHVKMLSTEVVIGICVAVSVCFLFTGSILAVWFLRYRDQKRTRATLTRGLSTYHRAHLSIDGSNYSHIQQPRARLRRSGHLPYGVVSEGWTEVPSQESLRPQQMASIEELPESDEMVPPPKGRKSLRQTLYGRSLNVPKTRRQKKIEKAVAQNSMPLSPLSVITEFTDAPEERSPDVAELPTIITPQHTPEKIRRDREWSRPVSIQWPLPLALRRSKDTPATVVTSIPARDSILIRKGSLDTTLDRPTMGRSLSMASNFSVAPKEPLPPLPLRTDQYSQANESNARRSNASIDTIGSSVLGSIQNSPQMTTYNLATPTVDLSSPGLHQFSPARNHDNASAITMGMAAGKRAQQGTVKGTSGTHSFRASIGEHHGRRSVSNTTTVDRRDKRFNNSYVFDSSLKTIDARNWSSDLPLRSVSHRSTLSPPLSASVARRPYLDLSMLARHSLFESQLSLSKRASNPMESSAAEILTGSPRQIALPRPASFASGNPYQWDLRPLSSFFVSPMPIEKGHRRQSCVRISNLPAINPKRNREMPEMTQEEEESSSPETKPKILGLTLLELENGTPALRARASLVDIKVSTSPSPFNNRPILNPTSRKRSYRLPSQGVPRPDLDNFDSDPTTPSPFDGQSSDARNNWPLSPTPRNNIKLNSTTPPFVPVAEPYDHESPTLPSPALTSATLFPRKSAVQGPRNQPVSGKGSRNAPPSPLNGKVAQKKTGDELRRSVMMLRRLTSEETPLDPASRLYRNVGEQSVSNFSLPNASQSKYGLATKNNTSMNLRDKRRGSDMALNGGNSRSKMSMAFSPSMMSMSGVSVWEDASVCDEADLEVRNSMMHIHEQSDPDPEAYENFGAQQQYIDRTASDRRDKEKESRLTSRQGKGLGISHLGTPGSLYDRDGFLKEQ
jgi:hypothetical protein